MILSEPSSTTLEAPVASATPVAPPPEPATEPLAEPVSAPATASEPGLSPAPRTGAVEMESVALIQLPELSGSDDFQQMNERLRASEAILQSHQERGNVPLDALLTATLDRLVEEGSVDGLLVGSEDGFVVARSSRLEEAELLAVVGTVFDFVARRIQAENLISAVEELTARGPHGEMVVMRYLPGLENRFFLVAFSREPATYRRTMARALKQCGDLLGASLGRTPTPRRTKAKPVVPAAAPTEANPLPVVEPVTLSVTEPPAQPPAQPPSDFAASTPEPTSVAAESLLSLPSTEPDSPQAFPSAPGPVDGILTPNSLTQN